jgi:hypothetical protein
MGYKRKRKTYVLSFDDPELAGLEVRARGASIGKLFGLMDLMRFADRRGDLKPEDVQEMDQLFRLFADRLESWNLEEEDGTPIEPTYENLMDQEINFVLPLVLAWADALVGTGGPLDESLPAGQQPEVASIPMEPLSASLPN